METLQRTANRGSISTGYNIDNSLKLERANSEAIAATNSSQSGNRKTWTFSTWIKRTEISYNGAFGVNALFYAASSGMQINSSDKIVISLYASAGLTGSFTTSQVFRDTSAWYHIVLTVNTTESTASNRVKLWVNGQQVTDFDTETYPNLNDEFNFGEAQSAAPIRIGNAYWGTSPFSAYIAETHYLNGTAKQASDFGEYDANSGIWIPKEYTGGGYGDIGFYYKYDNASSLGEDSSGEGHDASSLSNITSADQATDTPTNNFAHWNPLMAYEGSEGRAEITEGGTTLKNSNTGNGSSNGWYGGAGTIPVTRGKWYWEYQSFAGSFGNRGVGIMGADFISDDVDDIRDYGPVLFLKDGTTPIIYYHLQGGTNVTYKTMTSWTSNNNDIFAVALNMDDEEITFYRNGTAITENGTSNTTFSISNVVAQSSPIIFHYQSYANGTGIYFNFGGYTTISISSAASDANGYGTFEYAPPSGYYALCTKNLAEYG